MNSNYISSLLIFFMTISVSVRAQIGFNSNSPATGTMLHVEDSSKLVGVLLTKAYLVSLSSAAPLPDDIEIGTLIYNTNLTLKKGYYSWDGDSWNRPNDYVGQMAKFLNPSAGGVNLHQTSNMKAQLFGTTPTIEVFNDNPDLYKIEDLQNLVVTQKGDYQITVSLSLTSEEGKAEVEARLRVNNTDTGGFYRSSEMLANDGQLENGSISFTQTLRLDANDVVSVICRKGFSSNKGIATLRSAGSSTFFIQKLL